MRIRTVKPEFWTDEHMASVSLEACVLAIGLLNYSDDHGYFNANEKLIKAAIFPLRDLSSTVPVLLQELSEIGYIKLFPTSDDGKNYGKIVKFTMHQTVSHSKQSKIAPLCEFQEPSSNSTGTLLSGTGNREQGTGNIGARTFVLADGGKFEIDDELFEQLRASYPLVNIDAEIGKLAAWNLANTQKRKSRRGAKRHVNSWMSRAQERAEESSPAQEPVLPHQRAWAPEQDEGEISDPNEIMRKLSRIVLGEA